MSSKDSLAVCLVLVVVCMASGRAAAQCRAPSTCERYSVQFFFKANWFRASQFCSYNGMKLASITTLDEQMALQSQIRELGLTNERFWVSANKLQSEGGRFSWASTGRPLSFTFWLPNQPDNAGGAEDCVELWEGQRWNDNQCSQQFYFVCED